MDDRTEVRVPEFRGMQALAAWLRGHDVGVLCQGPDPDSPTPLTDGRVVEQTPPAGSVLRRWDTVTLWLVDPPEDAGVREPRVPRPSLLSDVGEAPLDPDR